jgi:hypothetical protein
VGVNGDCRVEMTSGIRVVLLVVLSMMWAVERSTKVSRGKYSCSYVSFVYCLCLDSNPPVVLSAVGPSMGRGLLRRLPWQTKTTWC